MDLFQPSINWQQTIPQAIKLVVAFLIALPIAFDREKATRLMGLRTFPLVAVASCGYVLLALALVGSSADARARVIQGLITGIGFIGGGAILKTEDGVLGTATAASIWTTGAVGAAVGFGNLTIALLIAALNFLVLRVFTVLKRKIDTREESIP